MKLPPSLGRGLSFLLGLSLAFAGALRAQDSGPLNPQQLDQLLGPIALYPDPLVALILPASSSPADVVQAARFLNAGGDPEQADNQPWSDSLRSLARYPTVVKWMDENLTWTQQLGNAFVNQPGDVMDAIQRLRARARATGALTSTAQQKLVLDGDDIEIVPAQPDVIYIPYYDPDLVYVAQPGYNDGPYLSFGMGFPIGFWLSYDFNWRTHAVLIGDRHHNWQEHRDWDRHGSGNSNNGNWHRWQPPVNRPPFTPLDAHRSHPGVVTPQPMPGAPPRPHDTRSNDHGPRPDTQARDTDHGRPPVPATNNKPPVMPEPRQDRSNRPPSPPPQPRPEVTLPPVNPPQPNERQHPVPPVTTHQDHRDGPVPAVQPPTRPDHRDAPAPVREPPSRPEPRPDKVPPPRVVNPPPRPVSPPPPPPATNTRDGTRDKDNEAQH